MCVECWNVFKDKKTIDKRKSQVHVVELLVKGSVQQHVFTQKVGF